MKSWKTTLAGLIALAGPIAASLWPQHAAEILKISAIAGGAGLVAARDNNVSSEQAGVKPAAPPAPPSP